MPLSAASLEVVAATLPAVGGAIDEITPLFYRKMFAAHPELIADLFNRGNQSQGDQPKALAASIAAFAVLQLEPDPVRQRAVLGRIAHKHVSLGITAEQYWIVHRHLFEAIVEVLGEAVTTEVASAWDELYWLMANTLIDLEAELYRQAGVEPGQVWRAVRVVQRTQESSDTASFVLADPEGAPLPEFRPGQYLSVGAVMPDGARQIRQYSLSGAPTAGQWRITVKRVAADAGNPAGEVSNHLHANVFEGDDLQVTVPAGDLVLAEDDRPLLLASAGIGCTPMLGMLQDLVRRNDSREVAVLHADRSPAAHAHRQELIGLVAALPGARMHRWYEDLGTRAPLETLRLGRADLTQVDISPDTRAYLCGPLPFMMSMREELLARDVPAENIHYEVFGPDSWAPAR